MGGTIYLARPMTDEESVRETYSFIFAYAFVAQELHALALNLLKFLQLVYFKQ